MKSNARSDWRAIQAASLAAMVGASLGFTDLQRVATRRRPADSLARRGLLVGQHQPWIRHAQRHARRALPAARAAAAKRSGDDEKAVGEVEPPSDSSSPRRAASDSSAFDAAGFAGYLAPYALALALSLAVTAAFIKVVMIDS
jgi:hypothetical protein